MSANSSFSKLSDDGNFSNSCLIIHSLKCPTHGHFRCLVKWALNVSLVKQVLVNKFGKVALQLLNRFRTRIRMVTFRMQNATNL